MKTAAMIVDEIESLLNALLEAGTVWSDRFTEADEERFESILAMVGNLRQKIT